MQNPAQAGPQGVIDGNRWHRYPSRSSMFR
jgi:hypothetical protein